MVVSLLNVERETAGGISAPVQRTQDGYVRTQPPLLFNLNVMLAAVFDERQYAESLSVLSDTLRFIQSVPKFEVEGVDYTIEIVSVTTQDMDAAGRAILPVGGVQDTPPDHRCRRNRHGWNDG